VICSRRPWQKPRGDVERTSRSSWARPVRIKPTLRTAEVHDPYPKGRHALGVYAQLAVLEKELGRPEASAAALARVLRAKELVLGGQYPFELLYG
jgi:hypothetical protein